MKIKVHGTGMRVWHAVNGRGLAVKEIQVQAQKDHILSLCTASPVQALSELIWNALDADAFDVKIDVVQNGLGGIDQIRISDDGQGINALQADAYFGNLGGSWKRTADKTPISGRVLHGRKGRGRFKAFSLGNHVEWRTTMQTERGLRSFVLSGEAEAPNHFLLSEVASPGPATGTEVVISNTRDALGALLDTGSIVQQLAALFALYLKAYPNVRIYYQGLLVNPVIVQRKTETYTLKASDGSRVHMEMIEWKTKQVKNKIVFCSPDGYALHEVDAAVRTGSGFNYTVYLLSPRFPALHEENLLVLEEMHPEIKAYLEVVREIVRTHFKERREALSAELFQQWQADGSYPVADAGDDPAKQAVKDRFDACAMALRAGADNFDAYSVPERKLLFKLLNDALIAHPDETLSFVGETLALPLKYRKALLKLGSGAKRTPATALTPAQKTD